MSHLQRMSFTREASKPLVRLQQFAGFLGWRDLRLKVIEWPESPFGYVAAYCTSDDRFNLQIGLHGYLGPEYSATIGAERYGISFVPHQRFQLFSEPTALQAEADRLFPLLGRSNFKSPAWRRQFAEQYPIWIMQRYQRRNKFLNHHRRRALQIAADMRNRGLNPYDYRP